MLYNPTIIAQILSTQANYVDKNYGQMFYYTDQGQIWYDTENKGRIQAVDIVILQYERERNNYIPISSRAFPSEEGYQILESYLTYTYVYVIETNCLYKYQNQSWYTIYGVYGTTTVAQTYLPDGTMKIVNADDVTTNGILNDGSVVVRDNNKMICGQFSSDGYTLNLRSLIGGCLNLDPSGITVGDGCLQLTSNLISNENQTQNNNANLNSNLNIFGNINVLQPSDWNRQYRLITEDIQIVTTTNIMSGSLIKAGSKLGTLTITDDTNLTTNISALKGLIKQGSKIYINSVINNNLLQPPYLFDTDSSTKTTIPTVTTAKSVDLQNTVLTIEAPLFNNIGDTCFITFTGISLSGVKTIKIKNNNDVEYIVDFVANTGIDSSARIVYYSDNKVKVLP